MRGISDAREAANKPTSLPLGLLGDPEVPGRLLSLALDFAVNPRASTFANTFRSLNLADAEPPSRAKAAGAFVMPPPTRGVRLRLDMSASNSEVHTKAALS